MSEYKPVSVKAATKERLDRFGRKGETYDELLNRLLNMVEVKVKN